jgi:hypothetical protein
MGRPLRPTSADVAGSIRSTMPTNRPGMVLSRGYDRYTLGPTISLEQAESAATAHGIDMRMFKLEYEPGEQIDFGGVSQYMNQTTFAAYGIKLAPDGRIRLTLWDKGLRTEADAVETISHELNHVRGYLKTGEMSSAASAEAAAETAARYRRGSNP